MSNKPLFVATHPRACSTAFERVFMTRRDILKCVHEPFGDAYYFGPERLAERYADDEESRQKSGFAKSTYQIIMERINLDNTEGKRLFIKDMAQYFFPPSHKPVAIAPSLLDKRHGVGTEEVVDPDTPGPETQGKTNDLTISTDGHTNGYANGLTNGHTNGIPLTNGHSNGNTANGTAFPAPSANGTTTPPDPSHLLHGGLAGSHFATKAGYSHTRSNSNPPSPAAPFPTFEEIHNPTVVPTALLKQFHFAFLIRHPRYSIPSYYRCCIPPLEDMTGFHSFRPDEAGYEELRRFFDYLRSSGQVGPARAGVPRQGVAVDPDAVDICVIDADDLLDDPEGVMRTFCESVGIDWSAEMLNWNGEGDRRFAKESFEKWKGFHEDAIHSNELKPRQNRHIKSDEELYSEWAKKYGQEGADVIRQTVADNVEDYEYLKRFCIKINK